MNDISPEDILAGLALGSVHAVSPVTGGWSGTAIWRVETGNGAYALRVFGRGRHGVCERESHVMTLAVEHALPVPAIHACGETDDRPWLLTDWLPGRRLIDVALHRPWLVIRLGEAFGEMQARLHASTVDAEGPADAWIDWPEPPPEAIAERLRAIPLRHDRLIHLDYHPENVLVEGTSISGVLDWTNAQIGDPRADLARTFVILEALPLVFGLRRRLIRPLVGRFARAWWRGYTRRAGRQTDMPLFCAWAYRGLIADLTPKLDMDQLEFDRDALRRQLQAFERRATAWERRAGIGA